MRPLDPTRAVVLGQFEGYCDLEGVADDSPTDRFLAGGLVNRGRWQEAPFPLRTSKRRTCSVQRVTVLRGPEGPVDTVPGHGNVAVPGAQRSLDTAWAPRNPGRTSL
ncbi:MAG: glucose-6-phosphate 1-dehydrogenase [Modestobacter sp.]|nr:glucose-6-phosphate 1-dehydrogenase [Modestobacter sp.]